MTHKPVATRSSGLHAIPDSQDVSRFKAEPVPSIWPRRSVDVLLQVFVWGFACGCGLVGGLWWISGQAQ